MCAEIPHFDITLKRKRKAEDEDNEGDIRDLLIKVQTHWIKDNIKLEVRVNSKRQSS